MTRREEMRIRSKEKKEKEIAEFMADIDFLHDGSNGITIPTVSVKREYAENYIGYSVSKYPNMFKYTLVFYKKDYPFNIYYSKEYYKKDIPKKYINQFEELEVYFN